MTSLLWVAGWIFYHLKQSVHFVFARIAAFLTFFPQALARSSDSNQQVNELYTQLSSRNWENSWLNMCFLHSFWKAYAACWSSSGGMNVAYSNWAGFTWFNTKQTKKEEWLHPLHGPHRTVTSHTVYSDSKLNHSLFKLEVWCGGKIQSWTIPKYVFFSGQSRTFLYNLNKDL